MGSDPASRERVRLVAQRIQQATGLDVDITAGSSSDPQTITLPAGRFGRPQLTLTEPWAKKGAVLSVITAVDRKSALLFALVLTVCALFVANGASAAVRARRRELGILSSLGWTPRNITASVLGELLVLGTAAGVLGAAVAIPLGRVLQVHVAAEHALLAVPAAVLLALVAGLIPAVRAGRTAPLAAIAPAVHPGRRAWRLRTVTALAAAQVARTPARTVVAAVSVAIGVGALTLVLAVRLTFQNSVVGTVLGDAVSIQVRGPDIIAVALTVILGLFSVGDVVYLSVRERSAELATLRATGWTDAHLIRLLTTEGTLLGLLGAVLGVTAGLYGSWRLTGTVPGSLILLAAAIGVGSASPLSRSRSPWPAPSPVSPPPGCSPVTDTAVAATPADDRGMGAEITVTDLVKTYGLATGVTVPAADHLTLTITAGSTVALVGPSGSGKSTLLQLLGGLDRPDSGSITVDSAEITRLRGRAAAEHRRRIGFVFQQYNLLSALTAEDNVCAPVMPVRTRWDKTARARELLAAVGLAGRERSLPSRLSGGQQQRVAIARALITNPTLVLADEPTGNLDTTTGQEILRLLLDLRDTHHVTIVIATHDPDLAQALDRTIHLRDGRITHDTG